MLQLVLRGAQTAICTLGAVTVTDLLLVLLQLKEVTTVTPKVTGLVVPTE